MKIDTDRLLYNLSESARVTNHLWLRTKNSDKAMLSSVHTVKDRADSICHIKDNTRPCDQYYHRVVAPPHCRTIMKATTCIDRNGNEKTHLFSFERIDMVVSILALSCAYRDRCQDHGFGLDCLPAHRSMSAWMYHQTIKISREKASQIKSKEISRR